MAKTYDLRIVVRRAEFANNLVIVPASGSKDVYAEKNVEMTLQDAVAERKRMSDAEPRGHVATLAMRYRDDRVAPGLSKLPRLEVEPRA